MFPIVTFHLGKSNKWKNLQLIDSYVPFYVKEELIIVSETTSYKKSNRLRYHENINTMSIENYPHTFIFKYLDDNSDEVAYNFHPDGSLKTKEIHIKNKSDDNLNSEYIDYYENGNEREIAKYFNDTRNGEQIKYYENGTVLRVENYNNGLLDGYRFLYFPNGQLKGKSYREDGVLQGEDLEYYENGQIRCIEKYVNGNISETVYYSKDGQKEK